MVFKDESSYIITSLVLSDLDIFQGILIASVMSCVLVIPHPGSERSCVQESSQGVLAVHFPMPAYPDKGLFLKKSASF